MEVIALLSLGFGLVQFDRPLTMAVFPTIVKDLHLSYAGLWHITGALAFTWAFSAFPRERRTPQAGKRLPCRRSPSCTLSLIGTDACSNAIRGRKSS